MIGISAIKTVGTTQNLQVIELTIKAGNNGSTISALTVIEKAISEHGLDVLKKMAESVSG